MKYTKLFLVSCIVALFAAVSCVSSLKFSGSGTETGGDVETLTSQIVVETTELEVSSSSHVLTVGYTIINAVEGVSLTATVESTATSWLQVEVGDNTITLAIRADDSGGSRSARVTLSYAGAEDVTLTVTQSQAVINVDNSDITVNAAGSTTSRAYSIEGVVSGESLSVSTSASWLSASVGNDAITLTITANTTKADRSAKVTLSYSGASSVSFTVNQTVPVISINSSQISTDYTAGTETVSFSVSNAVNSDVVTASGDGTVVTNASVNNSTVTLTISKNSGNSTRSGTVTLSSTYAKEVKISVVQETAYTAFLGTWTVKDSQNTTATIVISQNVYGSSYTVRGWQFNNTSYTIANLDNFLSNTSTSLAFPAYYNSSTQKLEFQTHYFTSTTYYTDNVTFTGDFILSGGIYCATNYTGTEVKTGDYLIASASLSSSSSGTITASTSDIISMEYFFIITAPDAYSYTNSGGYVGFYTNLGNRFPCTLTKVSSSTTSTSSAKSSEKSVLVLSEKK